jgi:tellurite methyltransferase
MNKEGGYDSGYRVCPCFWGDQPGSLVKAFPDLGISIGVGCKVWDAGCGEGKNALHLARQGASVLATDVSAAAIENARKFWHDANRVEWQQADVLESRIQADSFDLVVMYGLLHCLPDAQSVRRFVEIAKASVKPRGVHVVVTFNDRRQELKAHPGFHPTLLPDSFFQELYSDWTMLHHTDLDLHETHPHNGIPHTHSMTRLVARKVGE